MALLRRKNLLLLFVKTSMLLVRVVPRALQDLFLESINLEPKIIMVASPLVDKVHDLGCRLGVRGSRGHHGRVHVAQSSARCIRGVTQRSRSCTADHRAGHHRCLKRLIHRLLDLIRLSHRRQDVGGGHTRLSKVFSKFLIQFIKATSLGVTVK